MRRIRDLTSAASACRLALGVLILALLLCPCATRAAAQARKRVAVLVLESNMVSDAQANELRQAMLDALAARPEWEVQHTQVSLAQLSLAHDCASSDASCLLSIAQQLHVDSLVYGRMSHGASEIDVGLSRFDAEAGKVERMATASFARSALSTEGLAWQGRALTSQLFDAGTLKLTAVTTRDAGESQRYAAARAADAGISARAVAGYAALATAAISSGLSVFSFVQIDRAQDDEDFVTYRRAVGRMQPAVQDVCAEADSGNSYGLTSTQLEQTRASCNRGKTYQLLQFVFLGSAMVTGGLGAFLLLGDTTERSGAKPALSLQPSFSRRGGELRAKWRF